MKKNFRISYENKDGHQETFQGSYKSITNACKAVQRIAKDMEIELPEIDMKDLENKQVLEIQDNFHAFTVYHKDSLIYK